MQPKEFFGWLCKSQQDATFCLFLIRNLFFLRDKNLSHSQSLIKNTYFQIQKAPVYACLGNHEYYSNQPKASRFYREAGITLLQDSVAKIGNLCIIGRDDRTNMQRKSLAMIMEEARKKGFISDLHLGKHSNEFLILLDHQPYHLEEAEQNGIDFQFSGHTHHGQVWPVSWVTDALYEKAYGSLQKGNTRYYISSGMGIWGGKFRIGTQSEYIVLTIEHK